MNKRMKITCLILVGAALFVAGFFSERYFGQPKFANGSSITSVPENTPQPVLTDPVETSTPPEDTFDDMVTMEESLYVPPLSDEDLTFLEDHLFGQWRFSERIIALDQTQNIFYDTNSNISDIGVEELKKNMVISFSEDYIEFPVSITQNSLSNAKDMFLFGKYGGFQTVQFPIYEIVDNNTNMIALKDIYLTEPYYVYLSDANHYMKVSYTTQLNNGEYAQRKISYNFLSRIYIDPDDTDTIYVDFCGLWSMERDDINYSTAGKSKY